MRGLVRALLAIIGVLGVVVVGAVVYITTFFDPNDLKPRLIDAVRQQSGLELALDGPLNWSFYPRLGVSVEDARAWLPRQPHDETAFAAIERAEVSMAFAPLLSGDVAIDGLILDGMQLDLERDAQGRGNWEALLEQLGDTATQDAGGQGASAAPASDVQEETGIALDIARVQVENSRIRYADARSDLDITLRDLALTGTNVNPAKAFPLKASFVVDSVSPSLTSDVSLQSKVRLDLEENRYTLQDLNVKTLTQLAELQEREQTLSLEAGRVVAELANGHFQLDEGEVTASFEHPSLGEEALPATLTFAAEANTQQGTAQIHDLLLTSGKNLKLSGTLSLSDLMTAPSYTGQVNLAPLSLRPWLERFGVELDTANDEALSEIALTSPLKGNLDQVTLTGLTLVVDETTLTGRLGAGLDGQSLTFDLQGDRLDLDAYLPPVSEEEGVAGEETAWLNGLAIEPAYAQEAADELVPVDLLRGLSVNGQLAFDEVKAKGVTLLSPSLKLAGEQGAHRLESFTARLYDGTLNTTASLNVRETPIRWAFAPRLENVQVVPLVEDFSGEPSPLRGRLNLNGEFTSRTNSLDTLERNLNGQATFRIADGAIFDVNVSQELCTAVAMLEGETTSREWSPDTRFDRLDGNLAVTNGVVHNEDLHIAIPGIELTGEGELNLPTERFVYDARARFVDTADAACNVNPRLERVPLPVHCEGSLDGEPNQWCRFDRDAFEKALTSLARDEVKRKAAEKISEKIEERLGEEKNQELRNAIRGLFE
ncbi:AsmA family protein [Halomonas sp. McH1-25]|uniref:AsmA family protein n=3 Tax=Halomonas TaxID=2745 RepID=UPI001EF64622|nr:MULTISPECIES: AsmA family protein [unclassified Halomonas]MCG7601750.1 AsmA family protein [Halomonas sp. McH1-25]MCP1344034.1 AsmA family protein [Halomonas sp. FL8]MCP1366154.1 AsmA family protein [Halomonas sp. BBD48]